MIKNFSFFCHLMIKQINVTTSICRSLIFVLLFVVVSCSQYSELLLGYIDTLDVDEIEINELDTVKGKVMSILHDVKKKPSHPIELSNKQKFCREHLINSNRMMIHIVREECFEVVTFEGISTTHLFLEYVQSFLVLKGSTSMFVGHVIVNYFACSNVNRNLFV